jgi:hypothetical protein
MFVKGRLDANLSIGEDSMRRINSVEHPLAPKNSSGHLPCQAQINTVSILQSSVCLLVKANS